MNLRDGSKFVARMSKIQRRRTLHEMNPPKDDPRANRFVDDYLLYLLARTSHILAGEFHEQLRRRGA